jgi:hypothetical protein
MKNTTTNDAQLAKQVECYDNDQDGHLAALADRGIMTSSDIALPIGNESSEVTL